MSVTVNETGKNVEVHVQSKPGNTNLTVSDNSSNAVIGSVKERVTVVSQMLAHPLTIIASDMALQEHINDPEPHPAYDIDMPTLKLYFENGLI